MNYPIMGLDDVSNADLLAEVNRRVQASLAGNCNYCGYPVKRKIRDVLLSRGDRVGPRTGAACLFPDRHADDGAEFRESTLTFQRLEVANMARLVRWHEGAEPWTLADWSNAMCGEFGEAANKVKKIRRWQTRTTDVSTHNTPELAELHHELGVELADGITYASILAREANLFLPHFIIEKFNAVSIAQGFPERL